MIFKASEVTTQMQMGVDITKDANGTRLENNTGKNKQYPGGPVCRFKGKDVPAFACCSPSGGINSELLTQMLQHMDLVGNVVKRHGVQRLKKCVGTPCRPPCSTCRDCVSRHKPSCLCEIGAYVLRHIRHGATCR